MTKLTKTSVCIRISLLLALQIGLLTIFSTTAFGWGKYGHLTVCDLAYRNLTDASKDELKTLFNGDKGIVISGKDGVSRRKYTSFNIGCLEEDERPRKHPKDHFLNVGRDVLVISDGTCPNNKPCIFAGLNRDISILSDKSKSKEDRVFALMSIGHWIGDLHQPLHVSYADDAGGNAVKVSLGSVKCGTSGGRVSDLHAVWDKCLLEFGLFEKVRTAAPQSSGWSANTITYRAVDNLQKMTTLTEEKAIVKGEPWQWAAESFKITRDPETKYCLLKGGNCWYSETLLTLPKDGQEKKLTLDRAYLELFAPKAEERVRLAGFRLAHILNKAMDPAYSGPIQNSTQIP